MVRIPFTESFRDALLTGIKTKTTRTKRYGYLGDHFKAFGATFLLTSIRRTPLKIVADRYYQEEGLISSLEFREIWRQLHPKKGFQPEQIVWLHTFMKVS